MAPTTRSSGKESATLDADGNGNVKMVKPSERKSRNTQSSYKAEGRAADHDHDHTHDREEKKEKGGNVGSKRERQEEQEKAGSKGGEESMKDNQAPAAKATKREQNDKTVEELQPDKQEQARKESGGHFTVLEQGIIYFFYRPKVQAADQVEKDGKAAGSIDDVQNSHMLLVPINSDSSTAPATGDAKQTNGDRQSYSATTGEKARKQGVGFRLIRLGKKRLPAPEEAIKHGLEPGGIGGDSSEAVWSVITDVGPDLAELSGGMGEKRYSTRTRGERYVGGSRPAGRGRYTVMLHEVEPPSARSVRLVYSLSHPSEMGDVQKELGLLPSGSMRLSMRNPTMPQTGQGAPPAGLPEEQRVEMSKSELNDTFGGKVDGGGTRYTDPERMELFDREGVEILLIRERFQGKKAGGGARSGAGDKQTAALQAAAKKDAKRLDVDDVLDELQMSSNENPPESVEGTWI